jgi:hypothetical protein
LEFLSKCVEALWERKESEAKSRMGRYYPPRIPPPPIPLGKVAQREDKANAMRCDAMHEGFTSRGGGRFERGRGRKEA